MHGVTMKFLIRINYALSWIYLQDVKKYIYDIKLRCCETAKLHDYRFFCVLFKVDLVV